jgi:superfamily II helicase
MSDELFARRLAKYDEQKDLSRWRKSEKVLEKIRRAAAIEKHRQAVKLHEQQEKKERRQPYKNTAKQETKVKSVPQSNRCYACGDKSNAVWQDKAVCQECYDELRFGVVRVRNSNFFGGLKNRREDEAGPGWDNMIRAMEDRYE